MFSFSDILMVI